MERKDYKFTFPFEPPWEDLVREGTARNGAKVYVFDTCIKRGPGEQEAIAQEVAGVLMRAERRQFMEKLAQEEKEKGLAAQEPPPPHTVRSPSLQ